MHLFITLGAILLLGLAVEAVGRRTRLPRATLLLLLGLAIGPAGLDVLPDQRALWFPRLTEVALTMVAFLLGGEFEAREVRARGRAVLILSVAVTLCTAACVGMGLWLLGVALPVAVLLGSVATATDPAACLDVVKQTRSAGPISKLILGIVAIDDVWGVALFSVTLAGMGALAGVGGWEEALLHGAWELGGAIGLGVGLGLPMALVTGRIQPGEPTREEALGMVLLCCGLALWLEVSYLLAAVAMGTTVVNLARHHTRPFHEIEAIEAPFLMLFFVLAGASLELDALYALGTVAAGYIALRIVGRIAGAWLGGGAAGLSVAGRRWMGPALLPQAGVALGMALVAAQRIPAMEAVLPVVVVSTIAFEVVGPVLTGRALAAVGEAGAAPPSAPGAEDP